MRSFHILLAVLLGLGWAAGVVAAAPAALAPVVGVSLANDTSPPLTELAALAAAADLPGPPGPGLAAEVGRALPNRVADPLFLDQLKVEGVDYLAVDDPVVQPDAPQGPLGMPGSLHNFEGLANTDNLSLVLPPDPNGDIGYDPLTGRRYYVQWVNLSLAVWDVSDAPTATLLVGPLPGTGLFAGLGGACETYNSGDPIVLFDPLADRWLASQFAIPSTALGPFYQCIAVSATADPTGAWHRYAFQAHATKINDYPHFGVWPDGYYMSVNQFNQGSLNWAGAGAFVFERDQMLAGQPARFVYFDLFDANPSFGGQLPMDLDGRLPPPPGLPNYFFEADDNILQPELGTQDALRLWAFAVDWDDPAGATFGLDGQPTAVLPVSSFTVLPCVVFGLRDCIPQPGVGSGAYLDALGERLMHRVAYRNFGTHEAVVLNHTVDAGSARAGVRWYEVRGLSATPFIYQQGTYAPGAEHRWIGSVGMDSAGNLALGYNVSSASVFPGIRYTGRLAGDPLGQMTQGETVLMAGGGAQTNLNSRWGDYAMLGADPEDDCTFWFTSEYIPFTTSFEWKTRIGSFRFPNCAVGPQGWLVGEVTASGSGDPLPGALVAATAGLTQTGATLAGSEGAYALRLLAGEYTVTAHLYGYQSASVTGVEVTTTNTATVNFALDPAPSHVISGHVTDLATGAPLWAWVAVDGGPFDPPTTLLETDPSTGFYSLTVAGGGQAYTLTVSALLHAPETRVLGEVNAGRAEDFALAGTGTDGGLAGYVRDFDSGLPVAGAVVTVTASGTPSATTDAEGYYEILGLAPGAYTATAAAPLRSTETAAGLQVLTSTVTYHAFALKASRLGLAPASLSVTLPYSGALVQSEGLVLTNTGAGELVFSLREQAGGFDPAGAPPLPAAGGPDAFGYTWLSSGEPGGPNFNWVDATDGLTLTLSDDGEEDLALPFAFPFYGSSVTALRVGNNGAALINAPGAHVSHENAAITGDSQPLNLLAPFWDDLDDETGAVYWKVLGAAPQRRVVVAWHDRPHFQLGGGVGAVTFQMVLFEDGDILYQYLDVDFGAAAWDQGASVTVGVRGPGSGHALPFSHNTSALHAGLAICFDHPGGATACGFGSQALPWLQADPESGSLPGGLSATTSVELAWTAAGLPPGAYSGYLWVEANDPAAPFTAVPVRLAVLEPANVRFASAAYAAPEASGSAVITVTLSEPPTQTVTVSYAAQGGTAQPGVDYVPVSGTLEFGVGVTALTFTVPLLDDAVYETTETVNLALSQATQFALGAPATATLAITNDDPAPAVRFAAAGQAVPETAGAVTLTLQLSAASAVTATVPYTVSGTATPGQDHTLSAGHFVLPPGAAARSFSFAVVYDLWVEGPETVVVSLGTPIHAVLGAPATHTVTIQPVPPPFVYFFPLAAFAD